MSSYPKPHLTPEEYLVLEREAETKSEYYDGTIYAMAGASRVHTLVVANALTQLVVQLKGRPCTAHASDLRVKVHPTGLYTYPDIVVVCGKARFEDTLKDTLLNPNVIIEVLSKSTEAYDRGTKFAHYRTLESLTDYVLVSQDRPLIEHYTRQPDNRWLLAAYEGLETVVQLPSIACELPLAEVYDKVEWPQEEAAASTLTALKEATPGWPPRLRRGEASP